jgi:hypothetical protein
MKSPKRNGVSQRKTDSFCRTVEEGEKYWQKWPPITISSGENGLEVYVMIEIQ